MMPEHNEIEVFTPQDLTNNIEIVKLKKDIRKYLDKDQIVSIINSIPAGKEKMAIITLWMTGMRATELISIRKEDIDIQNNLLRIRWLKSRKYNERIIPIKKELCSMLQFYITNMKADDKIFPYTRQWLFYTIRKHFKFKSPHVLRHSFAVNFLRQSNNPTAFVILQRLLGHSKIQTTMEYLKLVPFDMAIELEKVSFN